MKVVRLLSVFACLCVVFGGVSGCSQEAPQEGAGKSALGIGQTEDLSRQALEVLNQKCVTCHTAERFEKVQFTAEQWDNVIRRMVAKGAKLSGDEMDTLRHWSGVK